MKRFIAIILCSLLICTCAVAEFDLSSLSFIELIELQQKISQELTTRPEWKEVEVPVGCYKIGEDIPAGHWTIKGTKGSSTIQYGTALNDSKTGIEPTKWIFGGMIDGAANSQSIELTEGNWFAVIGKPVVFVPYVKPALGF